MQIHAVWYLGCFSALLTCGLQHILLFVQWMLSTCLRANYNLHLIVNFCYLACLEEIFPFSLHPFLFTVGFKQAQVKIKAVIYN